MKYLGLLLTAVSLASHAQTARVIALSPEVAGEAKALYEQRDAINKRIDDLRRKVETLYLMEEKPGPDPFTSSGFVSDTCGFVLSANGSAHPCPVETAEQKKVRLDQEAKDKLKTHLERKRDWLDFEFSEDFKFIVPKVPINIVGRNYGGWVY